MTRPPSAQCRLASPCVVGNEPRSVCGAVQSSVPAPVAASAVQSDHAWCRGSRKGGAAPPVPGRRTKTRRLPSGEKRGLESREVLGAIQRIGVASSW